MQITIDRNELLRGLQRVQGVVERRNTMPILSHVLISTTKEGITLFATDLEMAVRAGHKAEVHRAGAVTLGARKLYEIVRELPEGVIEIASRENHWVEIRTGKSEFRIVGLPPSEFPALPDLDRVGLLHLDGALLENLIKKTLFAAGENDTRYILNGVLLQLRAIGGQKWGLRLVGTDGHRLAVAEQEFEVGGKVTDALSDATAIIPKKALAEVKKLLEEDEGETLGFGIDKNQAVFSRGHTLLATRLMDGNYPNYQQVIPKENENRVRVNRSDLAGALRRVSILAREKTHAVKLSLAPQQLVLGSQSPEMGEAREELTVAYDGEDLTAGFNARYLLDVLEVLEGDEATLEIKDPLSPCVVRGPRDASYLCVVMPMRV